MHDASVAHSDAGSRGRSLVREPAGAALSVAADHDRRAIRGGWRVVGKLNEATHVAMDTPAIKARLNGIGVIDIPPERRGPAYLAKYVVEEIARWEGPIKRAGLQVD